MLKSLSITNFALIEKLKIDWTYGLNVLTGETGAGKSIIIDALSAVLGGKCSSSFIATKADKATIEACFAPTSAVTGWLKQNELLDGEASDELTLYREVTKTSSRSRINGTLVNQSLLSELRQLIVTFHAQDETRTLMSAQAQLEIIDALGTSAHRKLLEATKLLALQKQEVVRELSSLNLSEEERERKLDFARFQLQELIDGNLDDDQEDEELTARIKVQSNVANLEQAVEGAYSFLTGGSAQNYSETESKVSAKETLQKAIGQIERATKYDESLGSVQETLEASLANLEEAESELRHYAQKLDNDPHVLALAEARLAQLTTLKKKYGPTISQAIDLREKLAGEIEMLEGSKVAADALSESLAKLQQKLVESARSLSKSRNELGELFSRRLLHELSELGMERCRFMVEFQPLAEPGLNGLETVEFMIAPNPGQPFKPLSKIASGGELSRVMLGIKSISADQDKVPTIIFDEIDTGLSGRVLQTMRDKLLALSKHHQILCVTHQPIVASVAANHLQVEKSHVENETTVRVESLDKDGRLRSLAAMASGSDEGEIALNFARALMEQSAG